MAEPTANYLLCNMTDGSVKYLPIGTSITCQNRPTVAQANQAITSLITALPEGAVAMGCDYVAPPGGGGGGPVTSSSVTPSAHPERSNLSLSWVQLSSVWYGKITENTSRTPDSGNHRYWWIGGSDTPYVDNFPTDLYFKPGTYLVCYYGEGPTPNFQGQGFYNKNQQFIYVGQPNT